MVHHTYERPVQAPAAPAAPREAPPTREPDVIPMEIDRHRARGTQTCYRCRKPGHFARDCKERDFREVVRGLTPADLDEIARQRGALLATEEKAPAEEAEEDFVRPQ